MSLREAWQKLTGKIPPKPKDDKVQQCAEIAINMAKLLRIDPQKVVDAMQHEITDKGISIDTDADIAAIVAEEKVYHVI
jgi:hypothetical protein